MKITALTLYSVAPRWQFLAIDTDEGITGWGEPVLEGQAETVAAAVKSFASLLIGQNPLNINAIWQILYAGGFYRGGPILMSALSGIDQALWDIKGKYLSQPVYELLGGKVREKMKTYTWVGGDDPADEISQMETLVAAGWDTFKLNGCGKLKFLDSHRNIDHVLQRVSDIRQHFGNRIDFGLDFHGRVSMPIAKVLLHELMPLRPLFVEEPVLPEFSAHYATLAQSTSIPLAAGERSFRRHDVRPILEAGGLAILQPDISHAGGITEGIKIASMADCYNVGLAPHCPLGPIALSACLTVDFISPNAVLQEQSMGIHYNKGADLLDYVVNKEDFTITDGYISPLDKPGLGVIIDKERVIDAARTPPNWKNPIWFHDDGSFAEW